MKTVKRLWAWLLVTLLTVAVLAGCGGTDTKAAQAAVIRQTEAVSQSDAGEKEETEESVPEAAPEESGESVPEDTSEAAVEENGSYISRDEVALHIHTFGHLPDNYITKKQAESLGWDSKAGNLQDVAPGKSIGGSRFGNYEKLLPEKEGRKYYECDLNYEGGYRGAERLIYSNDGLIFYTGDHYKTFQQLY